MSAIAEAPAPSNPNSLDVTAPASSVRKSGPSDTWRLLVIAVTIVSSAALLVAQQAAFRLLAPLVGSSIETFSAIISVFLIGIAIGNRLAGILADRFSPSRLVVFTLLAGGVSLFAMLGLTDALLGVGGFSTLSLPTQIFIAATIVCLLPGIALSLVLQPALRSVVTNANEMGSAAGRIFAWSTFGSLIGNYLAGFVLLALFGVRMIVQGAGWSLIALAAATLLLGWQRMFANDQSATIERSAATVEPQRTAASAPANWLWRGVLIVVACSFVSGAVEGAAFRILAPIVGVSMFLSGGVIGAVLAGMSLGNAFGGKLAERNGTVPCLRNSLAACAIATLLIAPLWKWSGNTGIFSGLGLMPQIVVWSLTLFFLPSFALGLITPQVIRLSVRDLKQASAISGRIYAWSTMGCVLGILASSWLMIEAVGAIRTSILCGAVPALLMFLLGTGTTSSADRPDTVHRALPWALLGFAALILVGCKSPYDRESKYFSLRVVDDQVADRDVRMLVIDRLVHSAIDLDDPTFLHYPHERVQGDYTRAAEVAAQAQGRHARVLVIGGGGYSYPRWVEAQPDLQEVEIDVVEIDPEVTEMAFDELGLRRDTRIRSHHMDGRQFVKSAASGSYDLVIQDAVNDYSVPYHLMTSEYNALIRRLLRPDGAYMLTVIDSIDSGRFLASGIRTVKSAFGDTRLLAPQDTAQKRDRSVFIIAARSSNHVDNEWWTRRTDGHVFPTAQIDALLERQGERSPLLTDDYAPVDILMTSHFMQDAW